MSGPKSVLVVEDSPGNAELARLLLSLEGWRVGHARNGAEALVRLTGPPPDVVLLDLLLPGISGLSVLREMARAPALRAVPVVVFSAAADDLLAEARAAHPKVAVLKKPAGPGEILAALAGGGARGRGCGVSVGDVTTWLAGKVQVTPNGTRPVSALQPEFVDWTYRPHPATVPDLPGLPLPRVAPGPRPALPVIPGSAVTTLPPAVPPCDCGAKLDALLKVLGLPEGLRGLVLALAASPDADALGVLADYLEERMDPRTGCFRKLAARARKGAAP